jgi:hypothetical protein
MSDFIPFVNSKTDCNILKEIYADTAIVRVSLCTPPSVIDALPNNMNRWVDPGIDIFHDKWPQQLREQHTLFASYDRSGAFQELPDEAPKKKDAWAMAETLLDACGKLDASWLSAPQLPYDKGKIRTSTNTQLAAATAAWVKRTRFRGSLVIPVILTHRDQVNKKPERDRIIKQVSKNATVVGARAVWVVDANLNDQSGAGTNQARFSNLIEFHRDLQAKLSDGIRIVTGPYWGLNVVIWARGLATDVAIGLGSSYQYRYSGSASLGGVPSVRVALPPLRRQAIVDATLRKWLDDVLATLPGGAARNDFADVRKKFRTFEHVRGRARRQVAGFYKEWLDNIAQVPKAGRALALFQDLTNAYVLGKSIKETLANEGTARRPERIAQQLMMNCL